MDKIKVSVIMPSLNVANYIEECLLSALNQTLQEIEIICIDAGSTDGTWELLNEYAKQQKYSNKIQLLQSDIKSYGYQVNLGIQKAKGKYIGILETDDYIKMDMYQELYTLAEFYQADMVKADYDSFFELPNGERIYQTIHLWEQESSYYNQVLCPKEMDYLYLYDNNIWKGIYNRDFLVKNEIYFNESIGAAFQDIGFMQLVLACANRVMYINKSFYRYRIGREMSSVNSVKSFMFVYQEFYRLLNQQNLYKKFTYCKGLYIRMVYAVLVEYSKVLKITGYDMESKYIKPYDEWFHSVLFHIITQNSYYLDSLDIEMKHELCTWLYQKELFISNIKKNAEKEEHFFQLVAEKNVYIFGAGNMGKNITIWLLMRGIVPICICDNNPKNWGKKLVIIDILSPEKGIGIYKTDIEKKVFIIANKYYYEEIEQQLLLFSIPKDQIIKSI